MTIRHKQSGLAEIITHLQLSDMPDIGGVNTDHDSRYYTETEIDTNFVPYTGATAAVDLGSQNLLTTGTITSGDITIISWST